MLTNWAAGNTASTRIVSQEVCVRGAGVCPGETRPAVCPNLTTPLHIYWKEPNGVIMYESENGVVATNLVEDSNGDCFPPPTTCPGQPPADTCIDGIIHTAQCNPTATPPAWQLVSTGNPCNTDTNQLSCTASPANAVVDSTNVTYAATTNVSNPAYQWYVGYGSSKTILNGETNGTYNKTFNTLNEQKIRTIEVTKSDNSKLYAYCSPNSIGCGPKPEGTSCPNPTGFTQGFACTDGGWQSTGIISCSTDDTRLVTFKFDPNITNEDTCPLIVNVENVTSCTLTRRNEGTAPALSVIENNVDFNGTAEVGTYNLSCTRLDGTTVNNYGTKSCYSNSDFQEN
jgi:hypothetical protein